MPKTQPREWADWQQHTFWVSEKHIRWINILLQASKQYHPDIVQCEVVHEALQKGLKQMAADLRQEGLLF